ncbi:flagellar FlbD family protein [Stomatohabitans albus]|uniref:flagellar FlbD family protein n=1 Tax=Stomatohabitans albus TaxID=3110766 RepID=UPI00300D5D0F
MIELTRLNGTTFYLNEDLIQVVEETPDTLISLIDGQRLVVRESARDITRLIIRFRAAVIASAGVPVAHSVPRRVAGESSDQK